MCILLEILMTNLAAQKSSVKANIEKLENSQYIRQALISSFQLSEHDLNNNSQIDCSFSGTTCVVLLFVGNKIYSGNAGDSRAILAKKDKEGWSVKPLSRDHKPNDSIEQKRIINAGGKVEPFRDQNGNFLGPHRVWLRTEHIPGLAMSRSIGDKVVLHFYFK